MTRAAAQQDLVEVWLGETATRVGTLTYARQGAREYSSFLYDPSWLSHAAGRG